MKNGLQRPAIVIERVRAGITLSRIKTLWQKLAVPAQSQHSELLDRPDIPASDLAANFRDIKFLNRWFGGLTLVEKSLRPMLPALAPQGLHILDLATGVGDIPLALARRWQKHYEVTITAIDLNPAIVELARQEAVKIGFSRFETHAADVFAYDFKLENRAPYDFVTCSLAFHHFSREQCLAMLSLMAKLARRGFVVNDLERSWFGYIGARLLCLTFTRHRLTRHDAPLSVLRAFTPAEFSALVRDADLPPEFKVQVKKGTFSRLAIVGQRVWLEESSSKS